MKAGYLYKTNNVYKPDGLIKKEAGPTGSMQQINICLTNKPNKEYLQALSGISLYVGKTS